jgi:hypothetical protein
MRTLRVLCLLLLFEPWLVFSQETRTPLVAVLDLAGTGVSPEERRNVSIRLAKAVSDTFMAEGMERRDKWRTALAENADILQNCRDAGCAQEAGKLLGADVVIIGTLKRGGGKVTFDLTAVDVSSGIGVATYSRTFGSVPEVITQVRAIALQLVQDLTGQKHPASDLLEREGLALLRVVSETEGALLSINGLVSATIAGGEAWRVVPINREIRLSLKMDGYYSYALTLTVRGQETTVQADLKKRQVHVATLDGAFGGGSMGSVRVSAYPLANRWFISAGLGFTIVSLDPLLVNLPVSLGTGLYLFPDSPDALHFYTGLQGSMNVIRILDGRIWTDTGDFTSRALLNLGLFLGAEYALAPHWCIAAEISFFPLLFRIVPEEESWIQLSIAVRLL